MNETAWCYLEGFGCKKDKVRQVACQVKVTACRITSRAVQGSCDAGGQPLIRPRAVNERPARRRAAKEPPLPTPPRIPSERCSSHEADRMLQFTAARYYRLAETNGNKTLGNTW